MVTQTHWQHFGGNIPHLPMGVLGGGAATFKNVGYFLFPVLESAAWN
jgi:hypothetical protein